MMVETSEKKIPLSAIEQALREDIDSADPLRTIVLKELNRFQRSKAVVQARELKRLEDQLGAKHARVARIKRRIEKNRVLIKQLAVETQRSSIELPEVDEKTWGLHGFVRDTELKGIAKATVMLHDEKGKPFRPIGSTKTDDKGYFRLLFEMPAAETQQKEAQPRKRKAPERLFIHVSALPGRRQYDDPELLSPEPGVLAYREVVIGDDEVETKTTKKLVRRAKR